MSKISTAIIMTIFCVFFWFQSDKKTCKEAHKLHYKLTACDWYEKSE